MSDARSIACLCLGHQVGKHSLLYMQHRFLCIRRWLFAFQKGSLIRYHQILQALDWLTSGHIVLTYCLASICCGGEKDAISVNRKFELKVLLTHACGRSNTCTNLYLFHVFLIRAASVVTSGSRLMRSPISAYTLSLLHPLPGLEKEEEDREEVWMAGGCWA